MTIPRDAGWARGSVRRRGSSPRRWRRRRPRARSGQSPAALRETYWSATGRTARGRGRGPRGGPDLRRFVIGFIEKNQAWDPRSARRVPHDPRGRDVRSRVRRAGPFFLTVTSRAATARQIVASWPRAASSAKVRSGCSGSAARVCRCGSNIRRRPWLDARRDFARLPPTLLQQPHPRPAHAVLHRNVRGLHPGITVARSRDPSNRLASVLLHWSRSTTTSPSSTRAIEKRFSISSTKRSS